MPLPAALQEWLPPDHLAYFISDIAYRALAANNAPDFRTVSDFRKNNLEALSGLFLQALALCQRA